MNASPFSSLSGTHVVDVLGNTKGRDQPIMLIAKALELVTMLESKDLVSDDIIFFDPFCKAGEILLACAMLRLWHKLDDGKPLDIALIQHELYESNRYFALSPDERHHRLSLRTFLGNEKSHQVQYTHIIKNGNYLSEIDGKLNKHVFEEEYNKMIEYIKTTNAHKKIITVGNPPYQESDGGAGASATQIYNYFIETIMDSDKVEQLLFVIPARWMTAGKNLDGFRHKIMKCSQIKHIKYFPKAEQVFPTVQIKGGVCFLHWDKTHNADTLFSCDDKQIDISLTTFDIIPDDPWSASIINKIIRKSNKFISHVAWSRKPFGLSTDYFKRNKELNKNNSHAIPCYTVNRQIKFANSQDITKNIDHINKWKVAIPKAYGKGMKRCTLPSQHIFLINNGEITTETYNVVGSFKTKREAEHYQKYLQTNFARYLLGLRKTTQDIPKDRWSWVPYIDTSILWTDEMLYKHFSISNEEQQHIAKKIKEWS